MLVLLTACLVSGTLSVLYLLIFVFVKGVTWGVNIPDWAAEFTFRPNFTALTGILAMSYFIHNIIVALMKSNKNPENNVSHIMCTYTHTLHNIVSVYVTKGPCLNTQQKL